MLVFCGNCGHDVPTAVREIHGNGFWLVECVLWRNNAWLHSTFGCRTPVEFEELHYDEITGALPDISTSKLAA